MAIPDKKSARKGEMSSCNVNASARGLAWAACIMANKGLDPDGKRIMSEESWKKMHLNPKVAPDVFGGRSAFVTQHCTCNSTQKKSRENVDDL